MSYQQEGYQRGPLHLGRVEMDFRAYAWTDREIENYKRMKEQEDFQLLGIIDGSVKAAMESLGDELMRYLREAGEDIGEKAQKSEEKKSSFASPYTSVLKGFSELFGKGRPKKQPRPKRKSKTDIMRKNIDRDKAENEVKAAAWIIYHNFKKYHG